MGWFFCWRFFTHLKNPFSAWNDWSTGTVLQAEYADCSTDSEWDSNLLVYLLDSRDLSETALIRELNRTFWEGRTSLKYGCEVSSDPIGNENDERMFGAQE